MRLKTAISIIDISTGVLVLPAMLGIVYCFIVLKGGIMSIGLLCVVTLFVCAFLVKKNLINYYLKRCKYPREFLSALEKRGLMGNLQVNWGDDVNKEIGTTQLNTQQFLTDNKLATTYGNPNNKWELFISFDSEGLFINKDKYYWKELDDWGVMNSDTSSELEITYNKGDKIQKVLLRLEKTNAKQIDLLLLLSHFKFTYG
jgi:hypothetical protein